MNQVSIDVHNGDGGEQAAVTTARRSACSRDGAKCETIYELSIMVYNNDG
jgi:hypothetical protein